MQPMDKPITQRLSAEALGSAILFATVIGSGIMAETLSGGNVAVALLGNTLATGAMLFVLINMLGPISGAHFNPAVTMVMTLRKKLSAREAIYFILAQIIGGIIGVWIAHAMFAQPIWQISTHVRSGNGQWLAETVASFGLLLTILGTERIRPGSVAAAVALYITAAYWFTASTSFANPAITLARSLSDSFAGIRPIDVPGFVAAQLFGALLAHVLATKLFR
jgi:glycerol uptake facilitator-like aquaporin